MSKYSGNRGGKRPICGVSIVVEVPQGTKFDTTALQECDFDLRLATTIAALEVLSNAKSIPFHLIEMPAMNSFNHFPAHPLLTT